MYDYKWLSGVWSAHANSHEDRRFQWKYVLPADVSLKIATGKKSSGWTGYDTEWTFECDSNEAIIGIESEHSNSREDRRWKFTCGKLPALLFGLSDCGWSGYANNYDGDLKFLCPNHGVVTGLIPSCALKCCFSECSRNSTEMAKYVFDFQCSSEIKYSDSIYFQVFGAGTKTTARTGSSNSSAVKWLSTSSRIQRDSGIASAPVWAVQCRRTQWQRECCLSNLNNRTPSLWKRHSKPVIPSTQPPMRRHTLSPSNGHCSMECRRQRAR